MEKIDRILEFWLSEVGPDGWYVSSDAVDAAIRSEFAPLVDSAVTGGLTEWAETPHGALALLILLDQFPRNLHRGSAEAFAGDARAREVARLAIGANLDLETAEPGRQFFYLPFEHSESLADQDWCVALFQTRMTDLPEQMMWHVEQHRDVIRRFGRFPFRNEALGRKSTGEEAAFLAEGGYAPGAKPEG